MCLTDISLYFKVDDNQWHKIDLSVFQDRIVLYIDCEKHASMAMDLRGPIDVNGDIMIAKYEDDNDTVPVGI